MISQNQHSILCINGFDLLVACDCNGLADSCVFDRKLYQTTGRGGRCINCKNNTDGVNCERCKIYHYRKVKDEACKPCNCDPIGSKRPQCNSDGQCACQPGVHGPKCDKCKPGYFGFSKTGCRYVLLFYGGGGRGQGRRGRNIGFANQIQL